jgi:hypothetical protein
MSDLQRLQDAFMKADAKAQQGDAQAREDARMFAQEIRRIQAGGQAQPQANPNEGNVGQLNAGIANVVDMVRSPVQMVDSAVNAIAGREVIPQSPSTGETFRGAGVRSAEAAPETLMGAFSRGAGQAAASAPLVGLAGTALSTLPGVAGTVAGNVVRGISSVPAFLTEMFAGGLSELGAEAVQQGGGGDMAQNLARVMTPMAIPAATATTGYALNAMPGTGYALRTGRDAARAFLPMTDTGARQVAREELVRRAGSEARATELGERINPQDPYNRTPTQQIGDPEFAALEQAVRRDFPTVRDRLETREQGSRAAIRDDVRVPGSVQDTRAFFNQRTNEFRTSLNERVDRVMTEATAAVDAQAPRTSESANSTRVVNKLKMELDGAVMEERALWSAVPKEVTVPTGEARATAKRWVEELGRAGAGDMPNLARRLLLEEGGYGETVPASELHRLYSKLRETARNARAGTQTQDTLALVSDEIAAAILRDLDSVSEVSAPLQEARAFSRALHETFDQGAVGRILKRTVSGDEAMTPEAALRGTVGRQGPEGGAAAESIEGAAPSASQEVMDYLRGRFSEAIMAADGTFQPKQAATWLRNNSELLGRYSGLRREFSTALANRNNAEQFATRARLRAKIADETAIARFSRGQEDQAVNSILSAADPAQAAISVVRTARKDTSGKALAGIKAAFSNRLIEQTTSADGVLSGRGLKNILADKNMRAAMTRVFSGEEMRRFDRIANAAASMDVRPSETGEIINAPVNALLMRVVQVAAAQTGGRMGASGAMGGSLQTANIFSRTAQNMLTNLTNDRARRLLVDAVEDPELMRALMLNPSAEMPKWARDKIVPYLAGAAATVAVQE